jgi:aldehyde dehydrogenase (NAD+)
MKTFDHFIDGNWTEPSAGEWFSTTDPYSGEEWAKVAKGNADDADAAVRSADRAFRAESWAGLTASARGKLLNRLAEAIADHADELAEIEVRDNGKLIAEVRAQCRLLREWLAYYAGMADKVEGRIPPIEKPDTLGLVHYEPYGVCVGITPWNSPLLQLIWKLAPALAAGNTFVLKPSEFASVSSLCLAEIVYKAGLPAGVFNVVTGLGSEIGAPLVRHPLVRRVAFTGGEGGGIAVAGDAAHKLIPYTLELGGKSANILFSDADLDKAVSGVVSGIFAASGQTCMAGSRVLVHESLFDVTLARLKEIAESAILGDPRDPATNLGPIATKPQYLKISEMIAAAISEGARLVTGGPVPASDDANGGLFVRPTIFADVTPDMQIFRKEVFGPVAIVMPFRNESDAIGIANGTEFGLAAGIWTNDIGRAVRVSRRLEAGTVWINNYRSTSYLMPFGGYKRSGVGRENGAESIKDYLQQKSVHINVGQGLVANPFIRR